MERLIEWLTYFNEGPIDAYDHGMWISSEQVSYLTGQYRYNIENLYAEKKNANDKTNNPLRPSMLGKPALLIAYNYYHPSNSKPLPNKNKRLASIGYYFEMWLTAQIISLGYDVSYDNETSLVWHEHKILCHADLIIDNKLIIECKEVSDWYYKQWFKYSGPSDDRGYLTQASLYSHAYGLPIMFIVGNRTTGEINFTVVNNSDYYVNRADSIVDTLLNKTSCWEDCFEYMAPESPNKTKKGLTVPYSMHDIADKVYELDSDGFVLDYKYPEKFLHLKPDING